MELKKQVGYEAAKLVKDGDIVGLGTGSTTLHFIERLGERVKTEELDIMGVPTSYQSFFLARDLGIKITTLEENDVDLAVDGADEVDPNLNLIKGGGAAHTREKVVSRSAKRFVIVADESKVSEKLEHYVPIEVLPYARELVAKQIKELGGNPELRMAARKDGPVITDNGNFVIDASFGIIADPKEISAKLSQLTGVVEHGIFTNVDEVYIGKNDGSVEIRKL